MTCERAVVAPLETPYKTACEVVQIETPSLDGTTPYKA